MAARSPRFRRFITLGARCRDHRIIVLDLTDEDAGALTRHLRQTLGEARSRSQRLDLRRREIGVNNRA